MKTVILKVGQVWHWKLDTQVKTLIIRIDDGVAYGEVPGTNCRFAWVRVDANNLAEIHDNWFIDFNEVIAIPKAHSLSRECLCGIFRGDCDYHRSP